AVGAQFERRGDAWPVRGLLGGKDLTGRFSRWWNEPSRTVFQEHATTVPSQTLENRSAGRTNAFPFAVQENCTGERLVVNAHLLHRAVARVADRQAEADDQGQDFKFTHRVPQVAR